MRPFPHHYRKEFTLFKKYNTPAKIQDFVNTFRFNFEEAGQTCKSPIQVLETGSAHCMEGAMLAAAMLWYHGYKPLLLDLKTGKGDYDHVIALFKQNGLWGAISKTNHGVLRYRDPIFPTLRSLVLSYFNEYFTNHDRKKTLKSFSAPFSLLTYNDTWLASTDDLWDIPADLDDSHHFPIAPKTTMKKLRLADPIEQKYGEIIEWDKNQVKD